MTKKDKKFVSKKGNPAKRSQELAAFKKEQENATRYQRAADQKFQIQHEGKPQNVGGLYQPPEGLDPVSMNSMAPIKAPQKKKATRRELTARIGGGLIAVVALSSLIFSSFVLPQQQQQQQRIQDQLFENSQVQEGLKLDVNGNPILVDANGNPLNSQQVPVEVEKDAPKDAASETDKPGDGVIEVDLDENMKPKDNIVDKIAEDMKPSK